MKLLFISDIHGIYENLDFIDNIIKMKGIDKLVVLGDLYYSGPTYDDNLKVNGNLVMEFLKKHKDILICMRGNCDSLVDIKVSDTPICSDLSMIYVDNLDIYITHGNEYNKNKSNKFNNCILVYGHEHVPYIEKKDNNIFICVGSISLPRHGSRPSYMIYENRNFTIYDINNDIIDSIKL